jgi:hypothetical protein
MTSPCEMKLQQDSRSSLQTSAASATYTRPSLFQTGSSLPQTKQESLESHKDLASQTPVTSSMPELARTQTQSADTDTSAKTVESPVMGTKSVWKGADEIFGLQLKYLRHNLWQEGSSLSPTTAEWSETAKPLPRPPFHEILNPVTSRTLLIIPISFRFELPSKSMCLNIFSNTILILRSSNWFVQGFERVSGLGPTLFKKGCLKLNTSLVPCLLTLTSNLHCVKERQKGYFSDSFGTDLFPGMYAMPIYAVMKPHSVDLRLVMDHSAGPFSMA